ncbi:MULTISPECIES: peptidoglycan-binding protein [unclassified Imperialibacter]|uniref:peptidoglycan-binding protein n=1 Tax=unclassified Imperialibacter TaxID=2629706 RepID=UPI0012566192|nr:MULTISPECIES: peptidoglycan-binding protein [unclassified Imperialibacter]CAD5277584.1 conserved exported hypothetical protein [Imperialibacter sp. 75]CAD5295470.1 conserved exported hypothetical protein [Imperialibacter sp. 89]VVT12031.1 exported hypothetical protein [Imperialibacter sp. EC-SDR9]
MKKILFAISLLVAASHSGLTQTPVELPTFNFFDSASYKITGFKFDQELKYKFSVTVRDAEEVFVLETITPETFASSFIATYNKLENGNALSKLDKEAEARKLFFMFIAASKAINIGDNPKAGDLVLNSEVYITRQFTSQDQKNYRRDARLLLKKSTNIGVKHLFIFWPRYQINTEDPDNLPSWKGSVSRSKAVELIVNFKKELLTRSVESSIQKEALLVDSLNSKKQTLDDAIKNIKSTITLLSVEKSELLAQESKLRNKVLQDRRRMEIMLKSDIYSNSNVGQLIDEQRQVKSSLIELEGMLLVTLPEAKEPLINLDTTALYLSRVKQLQNVLRVLKLYDETAPIDGIYDNEIKTLVAQVQSLSSKLVADGIYGPDTKNLLQTMLDDRFKEISNEILILKNKEKALDDVFNSMRGVDALYDSIEVADSILKVLSDDLKHNNSQLSEQRQQLAPFEKEKKEIEQKLERHIANLKQQEQLKFTHKFLIDSIQLEFKDGFIENIRVTGQVESIHNLIGRRLKFDNSYPFGFSRKSDFQNIMHNENWNLQAYSNLFQNAKGESDRFQLRTNQFINNYIQEHQVGRRDYSPRNSVHIVTFDKQKISTLTLHKTERSRLFEARVYSDFVGFQKGSENGILQTEISKQLNIMTGRFPRRIFNWTIVNFGLFSQVTPNLTISKIEADNKTLQLRYRDDFINGGYEPVKYVSTLDLRSHENLSVGFDFNSFLWDIPDVKSTFSFDHGFRYGRVDILDSTRVADQGTPKMSGKVDEFGVDTFRAMWIRANWHLQTVEDFQFDFNWSLNSMYLRDDRFQQVGKYEDFENSDRRTAPLSESTYYRIELNAQWNPAGEINGKIFFRYRYFWENGFWRTGFNQAQVGYSFFLTKMIES